MNPLDAVLTPPPRPHAQGRAQDAAHGGSPESRLPPALADLPAGTKLEGLVVGRDPSGKPLLRTAYGTLSVSSEIELARGTRLLLEVRPEDGRLMARILALDGKAMGSASPPSARQAPQAVVPQAVVPQAIVPQAAAPIAVPPAPSPALRAAAAPSPGATGSPAARLARLSVAPSSATPTPPGTAGAPQGASPSAPNRVLEGPGASAGETGRPGTPAPTAVPRSISGIAPQPGAAAPSSPGPAAAAVTAEARTAELSSAPNRAAGTSTASPPPENAIKSAEGEIPPPPARNAAASASSFVRAAVRPAGGGLGPAAVTARVSSGSPTNAEQQRTLGLSAAAPAQPNFAEAARQRLTTLLVTIRDALAGALAPGRGAPADPVPTPPKGPAAAAPLGVPGPAVPPPGENAAQTAPNAPWPALARALGLVAQHDPELAQHLARETVPGPRGDLLASLHGFIAALAGGGSETGSVLRLARQMNRLGHTELAAELARELGQFVRLAADHEPGQWRFFLLPFGDGSIWQAIRFFAREQNNSGDKDERSTRFVVEIDLSRLGPIQLDGLASSRGFKLILRSRAPLPEEARRAIEAIVEEAGAIGGVSGAIAFQTAGAFPVDPLKELRAAPGGNVIA